MAEDTYSLKFSAVDQDAWALNGAGKYADLAPPDTSGPVAPNAQQGFAGLSLALAGASQEINALTKEQVQLRAVLESLNTTLTSQRSLLQGMNDKPGPMVGSSAGAGADLSSKSTGSDNQPYAPLRPAINLDAAMADLALVIKFEGDQRRELAITNEKMASERLVAPSKASAVDLTNVEIAAAKAGVGNDQRDARGNVDTLKRQDKIVEFTRDAAITASAFKLNVQDASELLIGWRTSMNLDRPQTQDLADATSVLGRNMSASEADIGSILSHYGAAATNAGMAPEQAAALSAALLNAGVKTTDAGVAFEKITTTLASGEAKTPGQQAAWTQLGLDPGLLASGMQERAPQTIVSALQALKAQPAAERSGLATQLFSVDKPIVQLLQNVSEVERAFTLVAKKETYATSEGVDKSAVQQAAQIRAESSQAHWDGFNAQLERLKISVGDSVLPLFNGLLLPIGAATNSLSSFAEMFPVVTGALVVGAASFKTAKMLNTVKGWLGADDGSGKAGGNKPPGLGSRLMTRAASMSSLVTEKISSVYNSSVSRATATAEQFKSVVSSRYAGMTSSAGRSLISQSSRIGRVAGPLATPLMLVDSGIDVAKGVRNKDASLVGAGVGSAVGGLAGFYAGAASGAAIGTFIFPGAMTAVGGLVGGVLGGIGGSAGGRQVGSWLGDKLVSPVNRLAPPEQMSKNLAGAQANNRNITFAPVINISGQDPTQARQIAKLVQQTLHAQFMPLMLGNPLAARRDAALTDGGV